MTEMIKRSYYSDASHNYMVIACPEGIQENYQYKMLAANQILGLLPCSSRSIDSREYLYYDITSRQSLADLYERRSVRSRDLYRILEDLLKVENTLTEYLLDASHMLLDPACIYIDFREQEYSFAYYPGEEQENGWETLFTFLADRLDGSDKHAAALCYRLCMLAERPGFHLQAEMLEDLGIRLTANREKTDWSDSLRAGREGRCEGLTAEGNAASPFMERKTCGAHAFKEWAEEEEEWHAGRDLFPEKEKQTAEKEAGREEEPFSRRSRGLRWRIAALLMTAVGAGVFAAGRFLALPQREMILCFALGGAAAAAGLIWNIVLLVKKTCEPEGPEAEREDQEESVYPWEERQEWEDTAFERASGLRKKEALLYSLETPGVREPAAGPGRPWMTQGAPLSGRGADRGPAAGPGRLRSTQRVSLSGRGADREILGETCVLAPGSGQTAGLYGTGDWRGEQISLAVLPCVVGKMQEYVDQILNDSSVSRMHARFSTDREGKMIVRDLNSTNGTWVNGERLQPNESRTLQRGDHIRLGRMEFVYR